MKFTSLLFMVSTLAVALAASINPQVVRSDADLAGVDTYSMAEYPVTIEPASPLSRAETFSHRGFSVPDPFAPRSRPGSSFLHAVLATSFFRCWHILLFFSAWGSLITVLNHQGHNLHIQSTLLTVVGTVLGFVISYRTTSSFERYNEGRRLWSQMILACRTFSRTVWFHVPNSPPAEGQSEEEAKARSLIEKKSAINLVEAFSVSVKHYLRGEDGIYYTDLYYLVKFLPAYALPPGMPTSSTADLHSQHDKSDASIISPQTPTSGHFPVTPIRESTTYQSMATPLPEEKQTSITIAPQSSVLHQRHAAGYGQLPPPVSVGSPGRRSSFMHSITSPLSAKSHLSHKKDKSRVILPREEEQYLFPAHMPPKYGFFDIFPFSLLVDWLTEQGREVPGKKGARIRAKLRNQAKSHNIPLEMSLYISSYIASLQNRKICDVPTTNTLLAALNQLVDSLTGLERILTTPIPFSYSIHLWAVTILYCLALPFQIWSNLGWVTIPGTSVISFIFFGFLVAGEEIENPFGYDKNDLNLDHFTCNIIRNELRAVTSAPPPDPTRWAFVPENNLLFTYGTDDRVTPSEWIARGSISMQRSLAQS
ncbi:hypothetical protein D9619_013551 [Psilocybe cf. subviscida]|uniref:Uncharacterized protein n=1 Tax=Psilocybe cf. subviscida TaxID=2480587 RepID=A0A8H5AQZ4_9AGAR|nr:hypothetical protein D9619_013551 [Psilocybe cf. subviscida]